MPRPLRLSLAAAVSLLTLAALVWLASAWYSSRLPATYSVMDYAVADYGGGSRPVSSHEHDHHGGQSGVSVATLRGPRTGGPIVRFRLTAKHATIRLASGRTIEALTFNGRSPGPELRVHEGDLVEVTLFNKDVEDGVTIHWHGVDVPDAEDGVAGVTQDAVEPGQSYTYRFLASQVGTFWYHTHQDSAEDVKRGLYGAFVIEPTEPVPAHTLDLALVAHVFDGVQTLNASDGVERRVVAPGTPVRLRLINSDNNPQRFTVGGTRFKVVAIDGTDLNEPSPLEGRTLELAGGGRYDIAFTMPVTPVVLAIVDTGVRLALSSDGEASPPAAPAGAIFDPSSYGEPESTPFGASSQFDRTFELVIGTKPGFLNGKPGKQWTINGRIFPRIPVFVVRTGDLVRVTIKNNTSKVHPMHLHGHHILVLSRDGVAVSGSPWWSDTLEVQSHERYEVAFRADNPGIWMDHCHNLRHAAGGLTMHVAYIGYSTPFQTGTPAHNHPE